MPLNEQFLYKYIYTLNLENGSNDFYDFTIYDLIFRELASLYRFIMCTL